MAFWLALLLISTFTLTGLIALWAATSPRHWFVRTLAFLGVLSPLLLIPAIEVFVALALQGAIVVVGIALGRRFVRLRAGSSPTPANTARSRPRFSLTTLLCATALSGIAAAIAAKAPLLNGYAWQSVAAIGFYGGASTLVGYWAATRATWRRVVGAVFLAFFLGLLISLVPYYFDWFVPSAESSGSWPPSSDPFTLSLFVGSEPPSSTWLDYMGPSVVLLVFAFALIFRSWDSEAASRRGRWGKVVLAVGAAGSLAAVAVPALAALYMLLTPDPIPVVKLPSPNGFDDLSAAAEMSQATPIGKGMIDVETATESQLIQQSLAAKQALERLQQGLDRKSLVPVDYHSPDVLTNIQGMRDSSRCLAAEGRLAELQHRPEDAVEHYLTAVDFGIASCRDGLMIDALVGSAISGVGASGIHELRNDLSEETCRVSAQRIWQALAEAEAADAFLFRDRIWSQHALGWHGRLMLHLTELTDEYFMGLGPDSFLGMINRHTAVLRIAALELMARAIFLESGRWPASLDDLEAAGVAETDLVDPFDPTGGRLLMLQAPHGVVFYSVGPNGVDDGGAPTDSIDLSEGGDLRLDALYGP
jgi:hypothetical protein